jgi:hypothetical protein
MLWEDCFLIWNKNEVRKDKDLLIRNRKKTEL